jgi:hypothetical protein
VREAVIIIEREPLFVGCRRLVCTGCSEGTTAAIVFGGALVMLPDNALDVPQLAWASEAFSPTKRRNPRNTTRRIKTIFRRLGFADFASTISAARTKRCGWIVVCRCMRLRRAAGTIRRLR